MAELTNMQRLLAIMARLRAPDGCPWDKEQTFQSIAPYTLEETYEVLDAIMREDMVDLEEELGDLLLQVVFHAQMADEQGLFDFETVAKGIADKLERRHPHVFGSADAKNAEDVKSVWDEIKTQEKQEKAAKRTAAGLTKVEKGVFLDEVIRNQPALQRAEALQKKVAKVGFDWDETAPIIEKIHEELNEVLVAETKEEQTVEIGDLFFAVINLARHLKIDPETALMQTNEKFYKRFCFIETELAKQNKNLKEASLDEMEALWGQSKL